MWWWDVTAPGEIVGGRTSPAPAAATSSGASPDFRYFDSLGVEANGNICVASLATPASP